MLFHNVKKCNVNVKCNVASVYYKTQQVIRNSVIGTAIFLSASTTDCRCSMFYFFSPSPSTEALVPMSVWYEPISVHQSYRLLHLHYSVPFALNGQNLINLFLRIVSSELTLHPSHFTVITWLSKHSACYLFCTLSHLCVLTVCILCWVHV